MRFLALLLALTLSLPCGWAQTNVIELPDPTPAPVRLRTVQSGPDGTTALELSGPAPGVYVLEVSTNLSQWRPVATNVLAEGKVRLVDSTTTSTGQRFYRARLTTDPAYVPGQVLVQFVSNTAPATVQALAARVGLQNLEWMRIAAMAVDEKPEILRAHTTLGVQETADQLNLDPNVEHAEPNYLVQADATSNDPLFLSGGLWGMYGDVSSPRNVFGSQAAEAWTHGFTGSTNVIVGVVDTGIHWEHDDLRANIWSNPFEIPDNGIDDDGNGFIDDVHGWDFYFDNNTVDDGTNEHWHGTHVAGTVGAVGGNGLGVVGVNWNVKIISGKFLGPTGSGSTADAIAAVDYLTDLKRRHGLNIVALNNSWGGGGYSRFLHEAIIRAARANILFVASAGNKSANSDVTPVFPAGYDTRVGTRTHAPAPYDAVISVAAIDKEGSLARFSNYGTRTVDLAAPGVAVVSTVPQNRYGSASGTSMAAPHVTGAAALYAAAHATATAQEIRQAILSTVSPTLSLAGRTVTGGRLMLDRVGEPPPRLGYWDLRFEIVNARSSAVRCGVTEWDVRVTNVGNAISEDVCFLTGIVANCASSDWRNNLGRVFLSSGPLSPGQSRTIPIRNYLVPCGAFLGTQFIKVELNYSAGCFDGYAAGNMDCEPIQIEAAFWDLRFEIVNGPSAGYRCRSVDWGVKITNVGNTTSDDVCFISGIGAQSGSRNWNNNLGLYFGSSGRLGPGQSRTVPIDNYQIGCNAWTQTQYIKAEVHYSAGCFDHYTAGNYAQRSISIR